MCRVNVFILMISVSVLPKIVEERVEAGRNACWRHGLHLPIKLMPVIDNAYPLLERYQRHQPEIFGEV